MKGAINKIIEVEVDDEFFLVLKFDDGESKTIDFRPLIGKGISERLLEKEYFDLVRIDNGGGLEWPNGMDFCPNFLKNYMESVVH